MPTTRVIAFFGYKGCGKSEATNLLVEGYGYTCHSFAGPLKRMLQALGLTEAQLWGDQKEVASELLGGATPRWAMQSLGTEWGRNLIASDLWTNAWNHSMPEGLVTVDDLRFPNEAVIIKLLGGTIIKIERPGLDVDPTHESEKYVDDVEAIPPDMTIVNDGTLDQFQAKVTLMQAHVMNLRSGRTPSR